MATEYSSHLASLGTKLDKDAALARSFQENPTEVLREHGISLAETYGFPPAAAATAAADAAHAADTATDYRSRFGFNGLAAIFSITSAEARRLTFSMIPVLIGEAFERLSDEERSWVEPKLSGLELGMAAGIEVWKLVGQGCERRVEAQSVWPRYNPIWGPPICGV